MPIFQFIAERFTRRKFANISQEQEEALIDVLAAAKAIDGLLLDVERQELMEGVQHFDWKGALPLESYVEASIEKGTKLEPTEEALGAFFEEVSGRLAEDWLKEEAYYLGSRVALADDEVAEEERLFLKAMVEAFDIDSDRQQLIVRRIRQNP